MAENKINWPPMWELKTPTASDTTLQNPYGPTSSFVASNLAERETSDQARQWESRDPAVSNTNHGDKPVLTSSSVRLSDAAYQDPNRSNATTPHRTLIFCGTCDAGFNTPPDLYVHNRSFHPEPLTPAVQRLQHGQEPAPGALNAPSSSQKGRYKYGRFLCHFCPQELTRLDSLRSHMQSVHGVRMQGLRPSGIFAAESTLPGERARFLQQEAAAGVWETQTLPMMPLVSGYPSHSPTTSGASFQIRHNPIATGEELPVPQSMPTESLSYLRGPNKADALLQPDVDAQAPHMRPRLSGYPQNISMATSATMDLDRRELGHLIHKETRSAGDYGDGYNSTGSLRYIRNGRSYPVDTYAQRIALAFPGEGRYWSESGPTTGGTH